MSGLTSWHLTGFRRFALVIAMAVVVVMSLLPANASLLGPAMPRATCGIGDRPETGLAGEVPAADRTSGRSRDGYSCNMRLVGRNNIQGMGLSLAQMTWYKDCAYVMTATSTAIAVIDASDPTDPRLVQLLPNPVGATHEGIHASAARGILVLQKGGAISPGIDLPQTTQIAVLDLSHDCTHPRLLSVFDSGVLSTGIHSGSLSADGRTYYAAFAAHAPCLIIFDLDDPAHPRTIGTYGATYSCHDLDLSRDGMRGYIGSYGTVVDAALSINPAPTSKLGLSTSPEGPNGLEIIDISEIQSRKSNPRIHRISTLNTGRPHTEAVVHIKGHPYVVQTAEGGCANGVARIVDVTDEHHPSVVSELALEYQVSLRCAEEFQDNTFPNAYMTHGLGFDSADDSAGAHEPQNVTIAFMTAFKSGLRAIDVSDPVHPKEIGYYNPPVPATATNPFDSSLTWVRYRPETGHIWFGSAVAGFNIVELTNGVGPS
jgi:hypothetical protein